MLEQRKTSSELEYFYHPEVEQIEFVEDWFRELLFHPLTFTEMGKKIHSNVKNNCR